MAAVFFSAFLFNYFITKKFISIYNIMHEAVIFSCEVIIIVWLVGAEKLLCSLWQPFPHPEVQVGPAVNRIDNNKCHWSNSKL